MASVAPKRLLAKSSTTPDEPREAETLPGHLKGVGRVARALVERRGDAILSALGLAPDRYRDWLRAAVLAGALLHDIGKANDQFQLVVRGRGLPQALRHEVVGAWLISSQERLKDWLFAGLRRPVCLLALRAVLGHHLQFEPGRSLRARPSGTTVMDVFSEHPDFVGALNAFGRELGRGAPPSLPRLRIELADPEALQPVEGLVLEVDEWWQQCSEEERRLAGAVAATVIAADVCGSALLRDGKHEPANWAAEALSQTCSGGDLRDVVRRRLGDQPPRPFQKAVAETRTRVTLLTAGCGAGKTVAAYLWAARHAVGRKLFFSYPTTGTATEGFATYALPEFAGDTKLVHSRASFDIVRFLENGSEGEESYAVRELVRYQGLNPWGAKVVVCTADAVLGLVQLNRVGVFSFPALAGSAFVFDEVHLYDDKLFGALLAFIAAFRGAPILLMTATLPPARRRALEELCDKLGEELSEFAGPEELETLPRYELASASREEAFERAVRAARDGLRVLWVANTVERAVAVAKQAETFGIRVEPYHSRYRYEDRLKRHEAVVGSFRPGSSCEGILAATTQVCEVSLDISADLLVTELAPIASLIQRFGRLNRWATPESGEGPKQALVIEPPDSSPYRREDLERARRWLGDVAGRPVSQRELSEAFVHVLQSEPPPRSVRSAWLDEAWHLEPAPLREPGATVPVVREEDLPSCRDGRGRVCADRLVACTIPMLWRPVAEQAVRWSTERGVLVAPPGSIEYSPRWGARWRT
jgi:CRISPR-associated endonuclease/helicase Cas3